MLFVPPSMPLMIPEAEAADVPSTVEDLAGTPSAHRTYSGPSQRSDITLTWTAPVFDGGSPILRYEVKAKILTSEIPAYSAGTNWVTLEHSVYGLTYTHSSVFEKTIYNYEVFAINEMFGKSDGRGISVETLPCPAATGINYNTYYNNQVIDTIRPTVNVPSDKILPRSSPANISFSVSATDNYATCDSSDPDCNIGYIVHPNLPQHRQSYFPVGTTTVICTASDAAGNKGTETFTVTLDNTNKIPPTVNVPSDMTVSTSSSSGDNIWFDVTATDDVVYTDSTVSPIATCSPASGSLFLVGPPLKPMIGQDLLHRIR